MDPEDGTEERVGPQTEQGRQAMAGLRAIWTATGQMPEDIVRLDCRPDEEGCAASIGFDGFADAVEPTTNTTEAIDRLRRAWKNTLAREGKLVDPVASRPDLVSPDEPSPSTHPEHDFPGRPAAGKVLQGPGTVGQ